jgi:hypothetical protein
MGFLRRAFGGQPDEPAPPPGEPFDLPRGVWLYVPDELVDPTYLRTLLNPRPEDDWVNVDVRATLRRAPTREDASAGVVEIEGRRVGYLARQDAAQWTPYLDALAAKGLMPRVAGEIGASAGHSDPGNRKQNRTIWKVTLYASPGD